MIKSFFEIKDMHPVSCSEFPGKYKPITDLGYLTAEERINAIMSAGQILQEARANQHTYQNQEPDADYSENSDIPTQMYGDRMDLEDLKSELSDKMIDKAKAAANNLVETETRHVDDSTSTSDSEPSTSPVEASN